MSSKEIELQEIQNVPSPILKRFTSEEILKNHPTVEFTYRGLLGEVKQILTIAKNIHADTEPLDESSSDSKGLYNTKLILTREQSTSFWKLLRQNFSLGS